MENLEKESVYNKVRFYLTGLSILVACLSSFAFLFLVPFVIDPAFSTLFSEFSEEPVVCITTSSEYKEGMSNCSWSSCREGCTNEIYRCTQILVNYLPDPDGKYKDIEYVDQETMDVTEFESINVRLLPNIKGCGYPPSVNCTEFNEKYDNMGYVFPCYRSKIVTNLALTNLDLHHIKLELFYAIAIPWLLFLGSILYLLITYVGMNRPDPKEDEAQLLKAFSNSDYSLRSVTKTLNSGISKLRSDQDKNGGPANHLLGNGGPSMGLTPSTPPHRTTLCTAGFCTGDPRVLLVAGSLQKVHSPQILPPIDKAPMPQVVRSRSDATLS